MKLVEVTVAFQVLVPDTTEIEGICTNFSTNRTLKLECPKLDATIVSHETINVEVIEEFNCPDPYGSDCHDDRCNLHYGEN